MIARVPLWAKLAAVVVAIMIVAALTGMDPAYQFAVDIVAIALVAMVIAIRSASRRESSAAASRDRASAYANWFAWAKRDLAADDEHAHAAAQAAWQAGVDGQDQSACVEVATLAAAGHAEASIRAPAAQRAIAERLWAQRQAEPAAPVAQVPLRGGLLGAWVRLPGPLRGLVVLVVIAGTLTFGANLIQGSPDLRFENDTSAYSFAQMTFAGTLHNAGRADAHDVKVEGTVADVATHKTLGTGEFVIGTLAAGAAVPYSFIVSLGTSAPDQIDAGLGVTWTQMTYFFIPVPGSHRA